MTIDDVLILDCETTGLPGREAKWDTDYMDFPHVVQIAWINQFKQESHIIYPDGWEIPEETTAVHGITTEYAREHGEPFAVVVDKLIEDCLETPLICGHNLYFDISIIKANIMRELGREYYDANRVEDALYKGKRIDTMRPTMKWVDARAQNGRLKFPKLEELYSRCFPGQTFPAHDALEDVKAVGRCLPVIVKLGLVELKVKEYEPEQGKIEFGKPETARIAPQSHETPTPVQTNVEAEKGPQIENPAKITGIENELLNQNDF